MRVFTYLIFALCMGIGWSMSEEEYLVLRRQYLANEDELRLGGDLVFGNLETRVNEILMDFKAKEYREGLESNGDLFPAAQHFFHAKEAIAASNIFQIISILPKGGALHMHEFTAGPSEYVALELTKWEYLYYCIGSDDHLLFHFYLMQPTEPCNKATGKKWTLVQELRDNASSRGFVDNWFSRSMSMVTSTPDDIYEDADMAWYFFEKKITTISGIVNYEKAFRAFYLKTLEHFYVDNVMYIEMRGLFNEVYRLDGTILTPLEVVQLYKEVTESFMESNPAFIGVKIIYAPHRFHTAEEVGMKLNEALDMKEKFPDFFAGFDLVGQEDKGTPLVKFLPQLLDASSKGLEFFFHAGETSWSGTSIDENLVDAVLLNSSRIGHGHALMNFPYLLEMINQRGIAVEVCPISNQVLKLVKDVRNHPGKALMRKDFPVVISSDGAGIWGSKGLSHDIYYAFMAMGGAKADLKFIKQLAINSIMFSSMNASEKALSLNRFEESWSEAIDYILQIYDSKSS